MKEEKHDNIDAGEALSASLQWVCSPRGGNNFYGRILNGCSREATSEIQTAAVNINALGTYHFLYNPIWFAQQDRAMQLITVIHEAVHLVLRHLERALSLKKIVDDPAMFKRLWPIMNIAMDMAANDIGIRPFMTDSSLNFVTHYPTLVWPESREYPKGLPFEDYLARLLDDLKKEGFDPQHDTIIFCSGKDPQNAPGGSPSDSSGDGKGNQDGEQAGAGDTRTEDGKGNQKEAPQWLQDLLDQLVSKDMSWHEIFDNMTDAEIDRALTRAQQESKQIIRHAVEQTAKNRGTIPNNLKKLLDQILMDATIPWQEIFKNMVRSEISSKLEDSTINPNPAYFHLEDDGVEPYPGFEHNFNFKILLGIDTSGSVSDTEFREFMGELIGILEQEDGVSVRKILFDAGIQDEQDLTSENAMELRERTYRIGYGGTSFEPFLKYANNQDTQEDWEKNKSKTLSPFGPPDLVLLFTDGYAPVGPSPRGPIPQYNPGCPLIWVLTPSGKEDPLMQPRVVHITR